jgi:hypothetical protein
MTLFFEEISTTLCLTRIVCIARPFKLASDYNWLGDLDCGDRRFLLFHYDGLHLCFVY